jgi:hypothetical protein
MCQNLEKQIESANSKSWNIKPKFDLYKSLKTCQNPMSITPLQNVKIKHPCKNLVDLGRGGNIYDYFLTPS